MGEAAAAGEAQTTGASPRLHEQAERILGDEIASGQIGAGSRLLESRVASRFGISRAPVRQALASLAAAGVVARGAGRGYLVLPTSAGEARDPTRGPDAAGDGAGPLEAAASWERIYHAIEGAIVARTAFATWRVVESDLARAYGVSRTVARDVIARLNQRGVVRKDPKGRWIAPGLTPAHVGDLYELRWVVEPAALLNAYPRIPPAVIQSARAHVERELTRAGDLDGGALDALEAELHGEILGYCGNRTMMESLRHYQSLLVAHSFLYAVMPKLHAIEPFLQEHLAVLQRLESGHVREAAALLETHLRVSLDRAVHRIGVVSRAVTPAPLVYLQRIDAPAR